VFLSLPDGEAQKLIQKTFNKFKNLKYIDLSSDFRITDHKKYSKYYNIKHKAKNLIKNPYIQLVNSTKGSWVILELFQILDVIQHLFN